MIALGERRAGTQFRPPVGCKASWSGCTYGTDQVWSQKFPIDGKSFPDMVGRSKAFLDIKKSLRLLHRLEVGEGLLRDLWNYTNSP